MGRNPVVVVVVVVVGEEIEIEVEIEIITRIVVVVIIRIIIIVVVTEPLSGNGLRYHAALHGVDTRGGAGETAESDS